jgi:fructose-1,6-bisphosphatase/inositol monophosphatase family enzyme
MTDDVTIFLPVIRQLHRDIRSRVVEACEQAEGELLGEVSRESEEDTVYEIDVVAEDLILPGLESALSPETSFLLVAEGISDGEVTVPSGIPRTEAQWVVIVDPIDGTRGLMHQKRPGWILTGVARNRGQETSLRDIELAVQTEIPLVKQHLSDELWAIRGAGARAQRSNRLSGETLTINVSPSRASSIEHGFAMLARFFPGAREELAAIDEEIVRGVLGARIASRARCFEDQYVSTGGQLYELIVGHDRFVADLRPLMKPLLADRGEPPLLCCHPYDLCTELIAREFGVEVTAPNGRNLDAPLSVLPDVSWIGYANSQIRAQVEPHLRAALTGRGLV